MGPIKKLSRPSKHLNIKAMVRHYMCSTTTQHLLAFIQPKDTTIDSYGAGFELPTRQLLDNCGDVAHTSLMSYFKLVSKSLAVLWAFHFFNFFTIIFTLKGATCTSPVLLLCRRRGQLSLLICKVLLQNLKAKGSTTLAPLVDTADTRCYSAAL